MKVALIGSKTFDSLEYHTADSLRHLGHEVVHLDMTDVVPISYIYQYWASKFIKNYSSYIFTRLARKVISQKPEIVICTYRFIPSSAIRKIKNELPGATLIQLNPDQLTTFEKQQIFESPYDYFFTKDPFIEDFMRNKMALNAFYLPEAFNSRVHKGFDNISKEELERKVNIDVLVFGSLYPYRINMVKQLIKSGIKVAVFGDKQFNDKELDQYYINEWITGDRKAEIILGSKIVFNNFHYAEIESVNCKFFEIAGMGGFQICDYKPTIKEYCGEITDQITFSSIAEAISLIQHFLDNPNERYEIVRQNLENFNQNHTYDVRVKRMLDIVSK